MYATVFKEDPLDPARGRLYREKILAPGSSKDEMDLLKVRRDVCLLPYGCSWSCAAGFPWEGAQFGGVREAVVQPISCL